MERREGEKGPTEVEMRERVGGEAESLPVSRVALGERERESCTQVEAEGEGGGVVDGHVEVGACTHVGRPTRCSQVKTR